LSVQFNKNKNIRVIFPSFKINVILKIKFCLKILNDIYFETEGVKLKNEINVGKNILERIFAPILCIYLSYYFFSFIITFHFFFISLSWHTQNPPNSIATAGGDLLPVRRPAITTIHFYFVCSDTDHEIINWTAYDNTGPIVIPMRDWESVPK
jgi:hypothetical protein